MKKREKTLIERIVDNSIIILILMTVVQYLKKSKSLLLICGLNPNLFSMSTLYSQIEFLESKILELKNSNITLLASFKKDEYYMPPLLFERGFLSKDEILNSKIEYLSPSNEQYVLLLVEHEDILPFQPVKKENIDVDIFANLPSVESNKELLDRLLKINKISREG